MTCCREAPHYPRTCWQARMGVGEREYSKVGIRINMVDRSIPEIGHHDRREWKRGTKPPGEPMVWGSG